MEDNALLSEKGLGHVCATVFKLTFPLNWKAIVLYAGSINRICIGIFAMTMVNVCSSYVASMVWLDVLTRLTVELLFLI